MPATALVRSRRPLESSWGERMGASGSGAGTWAAAAGPEEAGVPSMAALAPAELIATEAVDDPKDIETRESDTKCYGC